MKVYTRKNKHLPKPPMRDQLVPSVVNQQRAALRQSLRSPSLQTKLKVGESGDEYEQEADRVADQVMRMPTPTSGEGEGVAQGVTHKTGSEEEVACQPLEDEEENEELVELKDEGVRLQCEGDAEPPPLLDFNDSSCRLQLRHAVRRQGIQEGGTVFRKGRTAPSPTLPSDVATGIEAARGRGTPLAADIRAFMEPRFGHDFSEVRINTGPVAHDLSRQLNAQAFTIGEDVFFSKGRYHPGSRTGRQLLAHELTHVVQQRGRQATTGITPRSSVFEQRRNIRTQTRRVQRLPEVDVVNALNAAMAASDKAAFMNVLRTENGGHATSLTVWNTIDGHRGATGLSDAEAWRAVGIQVLGDDTQRPITWPIAVKNFVEGLENGVFSFSGMPTAASAPATRDELVQTAMSTAHAAIIAIGGSGRGPFMDYQGEFNALWDTAPYSGYTDDFNPNLPSMGPRTQRSSEIFDHIYNNNATFKSQYDNNVIGITGGTETMRSLVDQYVGPESRNIIASPRLQQLRQLFYGRSLITSNNLTNAAYVSFKNTIQPVAASLDRLDRDALEQSHQWRLIIDWTVTGADLREDLATFLQDAAAAAAAIAAVGPPAPAPAPVAGPAPAVLTADQQDFINNLSIVAVTTPVGGNSELEQETLEFQGRSTRDPAGLAVSSIVNVAPTPLVATGQGESRAWPAANTSGISHAFTVDIDEGTAGFTDYVATLNLESPAGSLTFTLPTNTVHVNDHRKTWFANNIQHGLIFSDEHIEFIWVVGRTIEYFGGQQPLSVAPFLGTVNPFTKVRNRGIDVYAEAELEQNGVAIHRFARQEFGEHAEQRHLGGKIVRPVNVATADNMELNVEFFPTNTGGASFHTSNQPFNIDPPTAAGVPMGAQHITLLSNAQDDFAELNCVTPALGPAPACAHSQATVLDDMLAVPGQQRRIANAIIGGNILLEPTLIRPDSASFITAQNAAGHTTRTADNATAYFLGHTAVTPANTLIGAAGADGWRVSSFANSVFVNIRPSSVNRGLRRDNASMIRTIRHEAVHAVDISSGTGDIERYKMEFRAYWMEGDPVRDALSSAFNPGMNNNGPKSERSRDIFDHVYGNPTYPWVKSNYDANTSGFRDQVNAYIVPDGINLIVSDDLANFRNMIAGLPAGPYTAQRPGVQAAFAALHAPEELEIRGNRAWRELVESKYSGSDLDDIKDDLNIPR